MRWRCHNCGRFVARRDVFAVDWGAVLGRDDWNSVGFAHPWSGDPNLPCTPVVPQ